MHRDLKLAERDQLMGKDKTYDHDPVFSPDTSGRTDDRVAGALKVRVDGSLEPEWQRITPSGHVRRDENDNPVKA